MGFFEIQSSGMCIDYSEWNQGMVDIKSQWISGAFVTHRTDTTIHTTAAEEAGWNSILASGNEYSWAYQSVKDSGNEWYAAYKHSANAKSLFKPSSGRCHYASSQKISSGTIIGDLNYPFDYIVYKDNNTYYAKNAKNGVIISSSTNASPVIAGALGRAISGAVYIKGNATYIISTQLNLYNRNYVSVIGDGPILKSRDTSAPGNTFRIKRCNYIKIDGINFDGNQANNLTSDSISLVILNSSNNINIENCNFKNSREGDIYIGEGTKVVNVNNCSFIDWGWGTTAWSFLTAGGDYNYLNLHINQCYWEQTGGAAGTGQPQPFYFNAKSGNLTIHQSTFKNWGNRGIDLRRGIANISDCIFISGTYALETYDGSNDQFSTFENCTFRKYGTGVRIVYGKAKIRNCKFYDGGTGVLLGAAATEYEGPTNVHDSIVEDCFFIGATNGIYLWSSQGKNILRHNSFENCTTGIYSRYNKSGVNILDDNIFRNCTTNINNLDGTLISRLGIDGSISGTNISGSILALHSARDILNWNSSAWQNSGLMWDSTINKWKAHKSGASTGGASNFTDLTDTPNSYNGHSGKAPLVNVIADGLIFAEIVCVDNQIVFNNNSVVWA